MTTNSEIESPFENAGFLSILTYSWMYPIVKLGFHKSLEDSDIFMLPKIFQSNYLMENFEKYWQIEKRLNPNSPYIGRAFFYAYRLPIFFTMLCFFPFIIVLLLQPFFVNAILNYITQGSYSFMGISTGYGLALMLGLISVISALSTSLALFNSSKAGLSIKSSILSLVFEKSLKLSSASKSKHTTGQMVTLLSVDAERLWLGILFFNWLWVGPTLVIIAMILLFFEVGYSAFIGLGVMVLVTFLQGKAGNQIGVVRRLQVKFTDERTKLMNEILQVCIIFSPLKLLIEIILNIFLLIFYKIKYLRGFELSNFTPGSYLFRQESKI